LVPVKTKFDGPGNTPFELVNNKDIIEEAFEYFRINVMFKNFEINGPGDKVLVYLLVLLSHLFKTT
jgi:actin related protein 2/3 complex subunit 3